MIFLIFTTGSHVECQYALLSFGITSDVLPITPNGEVITDHLLKYLEWRRGIEAARPKEVCLTLTINDVLYGRGKPYQEYTGNLKLGNMIGIYKKEYDEADIVRKRSIPREIVHIIRNGKGRFLQMGKISGNWEEVSEEVAITKVRQAFFNRRATKASHSDYDEFAHSARKRPKI
jgi:hypothetical protein